LPEGFEGRRSSITACSGGNTLCWNTLFLNAGIGRDGFSGSALGFMGSGKFLDLAEFAKMIEIEGRVGIEFVNCVSSVRCFGDEQNDQDALQCDEGEEDIEVVVPSKIGSDNTSNDSNTDVKNK
jgi:hypothetical protein